jgi:CheY-like chemotaxis protein
VGRRKTILVVDDEPLVCQALCLLVHFDGHEVKEAYSAREALELFAINTFDLVFTDFSMPGMDGNELARSIRELNTTVPIVVFTGYPLILPTKEVSRIITKPFSATIISATIAKFTT